MRPPLFPIADEDTLAQQSTKSAALVLGLRIVCDIVEQHALNGCGIGEEDDATKTEIGPRDRLLIGEARHRVENVLPCDTEELE